MTQRPNFFRRILFFATCLSVGCTGSGMAGCGSDGSDGAKSVDSNLLGVYQVTEYRLSEGGCDNVTASENPPSRLVLYGPDEVDEADMVGVFCADVETCRARAAQRPANVNYAFFTGNDTAGWEGWGVADQSMVGEMCQIDVQTHTLVAPSSGVINIDTRQVETLFTGELVDDQATCIARDAVAAIQDDSPCQAVFEVVATFETGL